MSTTLKSTPLPHHIYLPLPPPPTRTIRLLQIHPSASPNAPLTSTISTHPLSSAPPYSAISYVWGDPHTPLHQITCNNAIAKITPNLHWALRSVCPADAVPHYIWADAICINQADDAERSAQVAFMGEIYARAERVLVCMGGAPTEGAEREVKGLVEKVKSKFLRDGGRDLDTGNHEDGDGDGDEWLRNADSAWQALAEVMGRPWFRRVWVIQEVGLAREPVVLYGEEEFGYRDLVMTAVWANRQTRLLRYEISTLKIHQWLDWGAWGQGELEWDPTFFDLLDHASLLSCSDPRDRIYAFLSHPLARVGDGERPAIEPDYTEDLNELYVKVTKLFLETVGLRFLVAVEHTRESLADGYPSWVIRWHIAAKLNDISRPSRGVVFSAGGPALPECPPTIEGPHLKLLGIRADTIRKCFRFHEYYHANFQLGFSDTDSLVTFPALGLEDFLSFLVEELETIPWPNCRSETAVYSAFTETICAGGRYSEHHRNMVGLSHLIALGRKNEKRGELSASGLQTTDADGDGLEDPDDAESISFWHALSVYISGRLFAITEEARLALVPKTAKPGDQIWVITGLDIPVVLRADGERNLILGESYVHGLMTGQAVEMIVTGVLEFETLNIG